MTDTDRDQNDVVFRQHADRWPEGDVVPALPPRPDLDQLRRIAKDRLRAARGGDPDAAAWIAEVGAGLTLSADALLHHGADPTRRDANGLTPLDPCRSGLVHAPDHAATTRSKAC